jgi:hypothetical protein
LTNSGSIAGGDGNYGSTFGGGGGVGVNLFAVGTVTNNGSIAGGNGYLGANDGSGVGGAGVVLAANSTLTNTNSITGGTGGNTGGYAAGANGGAGVDVSSGDTVMNSGHITGGGGGGGGGVGSGGAYAGGNGGAGVFVNGGSLTTSGTISGGTGGAGNGAPAGANGDAVQFGSIAGTLIVDPGAVFNGEVAANASVNDTLKLSGTQSGGASITLGTQFTNFSTLSFAFGAAWTVDAGTGAAPSSGLAINGFTTADTVDVTNLNPTQVAGEFNPTTDKLTTTSDGTLHFNGISGGYFLFSSDGTTGTDITLVKGSESPRRLPARSHSEAQLIRAR